MSYADPDHSSLTKLDDDAAARQKAVSAACARINMALRGSKCGEFTTPVDVSGGGEDAALIECWTLALAAWHLSSGRAGVSQEVKKNYADAIAMLKQIKDGECCPDLPQVPAAATSSSGFCIVGKRRRKTSPEFWELVDCAELTQC